MSVSIETRYRRRLYDAYLSSHFGVLHTVSPAGLDRDRRTWRDYFGPFLPANRTARIADLGCGCGSFLHFLRQEGYHDACGVDVSPEQVEAARALGIENVVQGDGEEFLEGRWGEFDCITAFDLLEHLPKLRILGLLEKVRGALRPDGLLILRVPNSDGPFGAKILYSDFTHELAFTPSSIRQALALAGFKQVEIHPEGPRVHGMVSGARWLTWQAIRLLLLLYLGVETGRVGGHILTQNLIAVARKSETARL